MFKIETIVKLVICLAAAAATAAVHASDGISASDLRDALKGGGDDGSYKLYKDLCEPQAKPGKETLCKQLETKMASGSDECAEAQKKFNTAATELSSACGEANISSTGGDDSSGGDIACSRALRQCDCRGKGNSNKIMGTIRCEDVAGSGEEPSSSRSSGLFGSSANSSDTKYEKSMFDNFKYCPALASKNYDQIKKDVDKLNDDADKKEEDLPNKLDEANKARSEGLDKVAEFDEKMSKAQTEFEADQAKAKKDKADQQKALMNQISQLQQQAQQLDEQIGQADLAEGKAGMQRDETKKQIDLNCHATASAQASKAMADFVEQVRNGQANLGGQRDIVRRANTTLETIYDRKATEIYDRCRRGKPTVESKDSADKVYDDAVKNFEVAKKNARDRKAQVLQQIKQIKDPNGVCGQVVQQQDGSNNETDMCRTLREAAEAQMLAYNKFARENQSLMQQKALAQQNAANNYMSKMQAYQQAQLAASKKRAKADSLERVLQAADAAGGSPETDSKAFAKAQSKYNELNTAAQVLLTCKSVCPQGESSPGTCAKAGRYLSNLGFKIDTAPPLVDANQNQKDFHPAPLPHTPPANPRSPQPTPEADH